MHRNSRPKIGLILSLSWFSVCIFCAVFGDFLPLPKWDEYDYDNSAVGMFSKGHILGTDYDGSDILSGLIHGSRTSLGISILSVGAGLIVGSFLGILAAYRRGFIDSILSMFFNVFLSVPTVVLTLVLVAIFSSPSLDGSSTELPRELVLIISLTIVFIPIIGRLARGRALSWTGREFVLVAESIGMRRREILFRHIVPNVMPSLISLFVLGIGFVIIAEGGFAIIGVGTQPGASWGSMLAKNRGELTLAPHTALIPATVIALTVASLNYYGEYLRSRIDDREARI